ncbi:MAG: MFS transporter [Treponema sp.]|nr:MFS transporter [Treponema sp.]MBQ7165455.1 MFS transporter [Treponema sp.]
MKGISKTKVWLFALGQFGWALLSGLIGTYLVNFYLPGDADIAAGQPVLIPQGRVVLGFLTVIGLVTALGRLFDAVTDPLVASFSDKCRSRAGRRIPFLKWSALPLAVCTVLVFCAPFPADGAGRTLNSVWLCVFVLAYYFLITCYCTPYTALYSEITHTEGERMMASTAISFTFIMGQAVGYLGPVFWGPLAGTAGRVTAIRLVFAVFAAVALLCMYVPVFAIREGDYVDAKPSEAGVVESLGKTFRNRPFRVFVCSDIFYWIGLTVFQTGIPYFVKDLIGLPEIWQSLLLVAMTALSLLFYIPINIVTRRTGKKPVVLFAFAMFTVAFLFTAFTGTFGSSQELKVAQGILLIVLGSLPLAIFGILPQAMVADCAEYDRRKTGEDRQGMFFAARTFCFKLGQSIAMILFTSLATVGTGGLGYRLAAGLSALLCLTGGVILLFYDEKAVR